MAERTILDIMAEAEYEYVRAAGKWEKARRGSRDEFLRVASYRLAAMDRAGLTVSFKDDGR